MKYQLLVNGIRCGRFESVADAQKNATIANNTEPRSRIRIIEHLTGKLVELWVGPVTFRPAGKQDRDYIAFSSAALDTIGAAVAIGQVPIYQCFNRGQEIGVFADLYEAAVAMHEFAQEHPA